jgi:biopolymer transport protein ExbD
MRYGLAAVVVMTFCGCAVAQEQPTTHPAGHFPFLQVDARERMIEVECEALDCKNPLEFFLCSTGTNEHEAVLRSKVKPSHLHAALLMLGLKPGEPVHFSEAKKAWLPPHGPPLHLIVRYQRDGKTVQMPAYRLMRDIKSKQEMPSLTWIFAGSRVMENGIYAADQTGYLVSVVNFDLTVIDIPKLASSANETLEWETNTDRMPPAGTPITLIITPAGGIEAPTTQTSVSDAPIDEAVIKIDAQGKIKLDDAPIDSLETLLTKLQQRKAPDQRVRLAVANAIEENAAARDVINLLSRAGIRFLTIPQAEAAPTNATTKPDFGADDALIRRLREKWEQSVAPRDAALREAARTHAEVIAGLRAEQQRLIDEADKIQRLIDQLEKRYQDMTTPP